MLFKLKLEFIYCTVYRQNFRYLQYLKTWTTKVITVLAEFDTELYFSKIRKQLQFAEFNTELYFSENYLLVCIKFSSKLKIFLLYLLSKFLLPTNIQSAHFKRHDTNETVTCKVCILIHFWRLRYKYDDALASVCMIR